MSVPRETVSDLREAIALKLAAVVSGEPDWGMPDADDDSVWALVDAVLPVFEAYLREHDRELLQAFLDNGVYAERWKVEERERIRQRIEALPGWTVGECCGNLTAAGDCCCESIPAKAVLEADVLEALGGSDNKRIEEEP